MMRWTRALLGGLAAISLLVACGGDGRQLVGVTRDVEPQVDAVALPDLSQGGQPFAFRAPSGGLLLVYFGYTNCPDACPTTFSTIRAALAELGDDATDVDVAMVSVDPGRDTPVLTDYVQSFVAGAHAIATDDQAALQSVAGPFGVSYVVRTAPNGDIEVGHTDSLFAVDEAGKLVLTWSLGTSAEDLAADIRQLLDDDA